MRLKDEEIISRLRALTPDFRKINKTALLHPLIGEIEAAMALGATRQGICDALSKGGVDMPLATLDSIMYRYRKKHGRTKKRTTVEAGNLQGKTVPAPPSSVRSISQDAKEPNTLPKTGIDRINEIMRSTPDLDRLAQRAKDAQKERDRKEQEQKNQHDVR